MYVHCTSVLDSVKFVMNLILDMRRMIQGSIHIEALKRTYVSHHQIHHHENLGLLRA